MRASPTMERHSNPQRRLLVVSWLGAGWASAYGLYRAYYALGGTVGMLGVPVSLENWYRINRAAALLLFATAVLALVQISGWKYRGVRPLLLATCWIITVGCVAHALIGIVQRIASLSGRLTIAYPFWEMIDRRKADLQALFFNEPWFLIQGLLWMAIAWFGALHASRRRAWWFGSVFIAIAIALTMGLLSAFGQIGQFIVG